jgi:methylglyoxal synthase
MNTRKRIALIAHDNRKRDLLDWARCTDVNRFACGPLGGDQQVGAAIVEGRVDFVVFFADPLEPLPHDIDFRSLLRVALVYNVPVACNRATADFLISSPLMNEEYRRVTMGIEDQLVRWVPSVSEYQDSDRVPTELLLREPRQYS